MCKKKAHFNYEFNYDITVSAATDLEMKGGVTKWTISKNIEARKMDITNSKKSCMVTMKNVYSRCNYDLREYKICHI